MTHQSNDSIGIHSSLHYLGNFGGKANTANTTITSVSTEFHVYETGSSPALIQF